MYPSQLTTIQAVDPVFVFIIGASIILLIGIVGTTVGFVIRYRRSRAPEPTSTVSSNIWLEILWSALPTILVLAMFWYGWKGYLSLQQPPKDSLQVTATARQWSWNFTYANGKDSTKLYVPVGKPVRVELVSLDVLHGFFLPDFRVKRDMVPNMKNQAWFVAQRAGSYDLFCSVYCGTGHSAMITTVEALPAAEFDAWLQQEGEREHLGKELLEKHGCLGCHSLDGSPGVGPTLHGIWGRNVEVKTAGKGRKITVDEEYLRSSILEPGADVVSGFPAVMPSFRGQLGDADLEAMIGYLRSGSGGAKQKPDGSSLAKDKGCLACHSLDGSKGVGPTFKGLYGRRFTVLQGGTRVEITADDAYLRESILDPKAKVVEGFAPVMPPFADLKPAEIDALVEFIEESR